MCDHEKEYIFECETCKKNFCNDCIRINVEGIYICESCFNPSILNKILRFFSFI